MKSTCRNPLVPIRCCVDSTLTCAMQRVHEPPLCQTPYNILYHGPLGGSLYCPFQCGMHTYQHHINQLAAFLNNHSL
jgi:hypothetical protein